MAEVPATTTPLTVDTAAYALSTAAKAQGLKLTRQGALLFLALIWVETGRGRSTVQHNVGNVMARGYRPTTGVEYSVWSGNYWRPSWFSDDASSNHQRMLEGQAPSAFRAYDSLVDGMADYAAILFGKSGLVDAANSGNVNQFVEQLAKSYSPDYGAAHVKTFSSLVREFEQQGLFDDLNGASVASSASSQRGGSGIVIVGALAAIAGGIYLLMRGAK